MILDELRGDVAIALERELHESREALHDEMDTIARRYKVTVAEVYVVYYTMRSEKERTKS